MIPDAEGPYVLVESTLSALKTLAACYRAQFSIPVIGVTGSVGKTSAKEMIAAVLGEKYSVMKTEMNLNNEIGVPLTLLSVTEAHEAAVVEMGISDFGEMSRLAEMVRPDICVMTNIGYAHLKELGDLNGVLRAKSEVFAYMKPDSVAILNGDDDLLRGFEPGIRKVTFGTGAMNDFRAENVRTEGTDAVLCEIVHSCVPAGSEGDGASGSKSGGASVGASVGASSVESGCVSNSESSGASGNAPGKIGVKIPAYGNHLVMAALPAVATGFLLGITADEAARGILSYIPVEGRANLFSTGFITLIDDSYNANPNSVRAALESMSKQPGRHVAILGDMLNLGERSEELHREIGAFAARSGVDVLICCGDEAKLIHEGYIGEKAKSASAGTSTAAVKSTSAEVKSASAGTSTHGPVCFESNAELIEALPGILREGDVVLVKASHSTCFGEIAEYIKCMCMANIQVPRSGDTMQNLKVEGT